ncbi:unnamed protein product [Schistosoma mattheei]|uniref:Uncharacterized protein n=1 Tax=Schistosoma mattheei TaxID=31246 RepID=A0AA85AWT7_9TREM|nr:unnamed protein product [Schistosoma mattheei]
MRLQAHEIRTRLSSHVPVAEYVCPYASATSRTVNNRYGVGLFLCYTHATLFSFLIFLLFPEPTPSTFSVWFRRLQSTLAKAGLATHALVNVPSRYFCFECLAYAWSRTWSLRSLLVFWLNVVSSYVCNVSGPDPYERNLQILDTNHSCGMPTQAKIYSTSLLVPFSENDLRWQLDDQRSLSCSPILPSYNRSSADQSHDLNRYLSKV